ncbi:hypothetical protein M378DRAFT_33241, partial [Amanita muscaria Koide BX008]
CATCLKWGHSTFKCTSASTYCSRCGGPHPWRIHKQVCGKCKRGEMCDITCINCGDDHGGPIHGALDHTCHFYINRNN